MHVGSRRAHEWIFFSENMTVGFLRRTRKSHKMVFGSCGMWTHVADAAGGSSICLRGFGCEPGVRLWNLDFRYEGAAPWLLHHIYIYLFIYLHIISIYLSIYLPNYLSISISISISIIYLSIYLSK
ncbi:unnamed protein product [Cladocopium goreaui]|uniref:Uncharacterized protein n=1 Tax=Cladocopium goreaui TaxID=2562237 RepID=A0A9P1DAC3_9DINO|nr:unnamed protein product [Cladocopium goreaui]